LDLFFLGNLLNGETLERLLLLSYPKTLRRLRLEEEDNWKYNSAIDEKSDVKLENLRQQSRESKKSQEAQKTSKKNAEMLNLEMLNYFSCRDNNQQKRRGGSATASCFGDVVRS